MIVALPTESGVSKLKVYGRLEIGDVPRPAAIEKAIPNDIIQRPAISMTIRRIRGFFIAVLYNKTAQKTILHIVPTVLSVFIKKYREDSISL